MLAWQYADDAWAVIQNETGADGRVLPAAAEVSIANGLRTGPPIPARIPFTPGYLPAGWELASVSGQSFAAEDTGSVSVLSAKPDPASGAPSGADTPAIEIVIGQHDTPPPDAPKLKAKRCDAARHWCTWPIPGNKYYVTVSDPAAKMSTTELLKIGNGLVLGNIDKPATWHPVG